MPWPTRSYLVACYPRTGSWLLCHALADTGLLGSPEEFFNPDTEAFWAGRGGVRAPGEGGGYRDFLSAVFRLGSTPNGYFGARLMWECIDWFVDRARSLPELAGLGVAELLLAVFPRLRLVVLQRRNKVRAAVSYWRAATSGIWAVKPDGTPAWDTPVVQFKSGNRFDPAVISDLHRRAHEHERAWQQLADQIGVPRLIVQYEEFAADRAGVLRGVSAFLGEPLAAATVPPARLRRQADANTERWIAEWTAATGGCRDCDHRR
jgi:LPS sulfotransferase NodH